MPTIAWAAVSIFGVLLAVPVFASLILGRADNPYLDALAWLKDNARWGQAACIAIFAGLLSKVIYEEHRDVEDRLLEVEADLASLKEIHPQLLIDLPTEPYIDAHRGTIFASVSNDSQHLTVYGVRLFVEKIHRDGHDENLLPVALDRRIQLRSTAPVEGVTLASGDSTRIDLASYDNSQGGIRVGNHHDDGSFILSPGTYHLELRCLGRNARYGSLKCMIGVSDNRLTYQVI